MWKQSILARLNATCFDVALLLAHFWSQFLTDFHKWPFVLKLRTCSFICTYCYDPTMPIMGPKRGRTGPKWGRKLSTLCGQVLQQIVFRSQACWRACSVSLLTAGVKCSHETNSFHFIHWRKRSVIIPVKRIKKLFVNSNQSTDLNALWEFLMVSDLSIGICWFWIKI